MRNLTLEAIVLALIVSACVQDSPTLEGPPGNLEQPDAVTVVATEFSFEVASEIDSGVVEVTVQNTGTESHQAVLFKLDDGQTAQTFAAAVERDPTGASALEIGKFAGGPNRAAPGASATATQDLDPGNYVFVCFVPSPSDGKPHITKGMLQPVVVTDQQSETEAPETDATITTREFEFDVPAGLGTGEVEIGVANDGDQPHEVALLKAAAGRAAAEVQDFFAAPPDRGPEGPPPSTEAGGIGAIMPGQQGSFTASLERGMYALVCFVADPKDRVRHVAKGMFASFTVGEGKPASGETSQGP